MTYSGRPNQDRERRWTLILTALASAPSPGRQAPRPRCVAAGVREPGTAVLRGWRPRVTLTGPVTATARTRAWPLPQERLYFSQTKTAAGRAGRGDAGGCARERRVDSLPSLRHEQTVNMGMPSQPGTPSLQFRGDRRSRPNKGTCRARTRCWWGGMKSFAGRGIPGAFSGEAHRSSPATPADTPFRTE